MLKSLYWLKIPEHIHFKVRSLTYNCMQSSQSTYIRELFTIQQTSYTWSSSYFTLYRSPVTSKLLFSNWAISITAPRLCNDLPPDLRTMILLTPPPLPLARHHLHQLLYPSPPGLPLKIKMPSLQKISSSGSSDYPPFQSKRHPP